MNNKYHLFNFHKYLFKHFIFPFLLKYMWYLSLFCKDNMFSVVYLYREKSSCLFSDIIKFYSLPMLNVLLMPAFLLVLHDFEFKMLLRCEILFWLEARINWSFNLQIHFNWVIFYKTNSLIANNCNLNISLRIKTQRII